MRIISKQPGFSLIELAIVLFIISLILGGLLPPLATQIEQREREKTQDQLDEIKEVIYGYVLQNRYFPCPDCRDNTGNCAAATANDGIEDTISGVGTSLDCATEAGNLPWSSLGVRENDAWAQRFTYRVYIEFADRNGGSDSDGAPASPVAPGTTGSTGCSPTTSGVSFALCSGGNITILDSDGGANVATNVPAIVVSHGGNWDEDPSDDEDENYDDGRAGDVAGTFVYRDFSSEAGNGFDDLMTWISPHVLRTRMLDAGILP